MSQTPKCDAEGTELVTLEFAKQIEREKEKWRTLAIERKRYLRAANKAVERNSMVAQLAIARNVMNWKALCETREQLTEALKRIGAMEGE